MVFEDWHLSAEALIDVTMAFRTCKVAVDFLVHSGIPEFDGLGHDFPFIAIPAAIAMRQTVFYNYHNYPNDQ